MSALSYDPVTRAFRRPSAIAAPAGPVNTATAGVATDSQTPVVTGWGTGLSNRGTEVTVPLKRLHDMTPMERRTSIQRSRFIENRLGLGRALIEGSSRYSIGSGISSFASTGDQAFDDEVNRFTDALFEDRENFDLRGELDFYEMQEVVCPAMMVDGDCGFAKILSRDPVSGRILGRPGIQLFTTDQIESLSPGIRDAPGEFLEGIQRNEYGRITKYRVLQNPLPGQMPLRFGHTNGRQDYRDYERRDFGLVLDPKRIGISRGIPWTHHAQASAITMMDLKTLEESAAYLNAFFGAVIETPDGEVPRGFESMVFNTRGNQTSENPTSAEDATTTTEGYRQYANFMGGVMIPVMKKGESLKMVASTRPSNTFTGFMDWCVNDIAWGFGIPPSFVWAIAGAKGPEVRQTLIQADWFFQYIMRRMVSRFCKPIRDWIIDYGLVTRQINGGRMPSNGASPYLCRWHGPRKLTIDEGREGKLEIERIKAGLGTEEEYHARRGEDGAIVARKRIREIARNKQWCKEDGVDYREFCAAQPGQDTGQGNATDPDTLRQMLEETADGSN